MENIGTNEKLIDKLSGELSLTSCKICKIDIYIPDEDLIIDVHLKLCFSKNGQNVKLRFSGILEYSFIYNADYIFYNVEIYKFFKIGNHIYISFDPIDENESISNGDQDYILSEKVEGYFISKDD